MVTHGISPKVLLPTLTGLFVGALLLIVGIATGDGSLEASGAGVLLAAAGHGGVGFLAPSGPVAVDAQPLDSEPVVESTSPRPARKRPAA